MIFVEFPHKGAGLDGGESVFQAFLSSDKAGFSLRITCMLTVGIIFLWIYLLYLVNLCAKMQWRPDQQA
jgi:hypothetical protein